MRSYHHHIGDFNNATRHLSRIERSIYRDLIELYYDIEKPLPDDIQWVCRRIVASECSTDVERLLNEFFIKTPLGWYQDRCEHEIDKYRSLTSQKALAGKASAAKRAEKRQRALSGCSTSVEIPLNGTSTNQEPRTKNQEPLLIPTSSDDDISAQKIPYDKIFDLFSEVCVSLPKVLIKDEKRKALIKSIWNMDKQHQDIDFFKWLFSRVEASDFLTGRKTEWKAGFDWVFKSSNFKKIVEGNYDNK